ncbi:MAG: TaqI-like C-terminal specificity domain-containing protein [Pyrinomonadaceae bacterium]
MKLNAQTPKLTLNKAFLKQRPLRSEIELVKANLKTLLAKVETKESEENKKNHVRDFLLDTYYKGKNEVNTKDRKDLVIHIDKTNDSNVGVIIEAKTPESPDRIKLDRINAKAFHELVLYYFDERHSKNNSELKNLIVTNIYEWFIFDANVFDKLIYRNSQIKRLYETFKNDKKDNPFFYEELRKILEATDEEIACAYFNLKDYETILNNADLEDDKNLIELFKILSPYHLLKVPFANDSNTLNKPFYDELLHIIGLEEIKDKSKTIIQRKDESRRNAGSLLENAITILKTKDSLRKIPNISDYGSEGEEKYFNVALELCITWINRILFLKLLEAQLVIYHKGNLDYRFLNFETIPEFNELFTLFHQVLAKTFEDRESIVKEKYKRVPYLNSSLFEISDLEEQTITIESLKDSAQLPFINSTILKEIKTQGKVLNTLEYLFKFLDAYDFASEGVEAVQADNRSLINASVLGKIYEKINGFKDGGIFTPAFITMYMCRQTIRLAVVQKFKDRYEIDIENFDDLKNFISNIYKTEKIKEYNELINSIHLCDPAVGSGHFLVSSLNEIIAIKSELGILADAKGIRLSDFEIQIENDELIITDEKGDFFEYQINADGKPTAKAQRLQKTLFHEKQTIIENCLFGVDKNSISVKISRLRLWIELLKNAYYKESSSFGELETLPNIDINIKLGNSLLSRFALDEDLKQVLKTLKYNVKDYRNFVLGYKETRDREAKREFETKIKQIKDDFKTQLFHFSPERKKRREIKGELEKILNQPRFFEENEEIKIKEQKKIKELQDKLEKQNDLIMQIEENALYKNAFEWRFEFPEVLDNEGNFLGFDIVIGNPPYGVRLDSELRKYLVNFDALVPDFEIYLYFISKGISLVKSKGQLIYIQPNTFLAILYGKNYRNKILNNYKINEIIDLSSQETFEEASVRACILNIQNIEPNNSDHISFKKADDERKFYDQKYFSKHELTVNIENWLSFFNQTNEITMTVKKIRNDTKKVSDFCDVIRGYIAYRRSDLVRIYGEIKGNEIIDKRLWHSNIKLNEDYREEILGKDLSKYSYNERSLFVKYGKHLASFVDERFYIKPHIVIREIAEKTLVCAYIEKEIYSSSSTHLVIQKSENVSLKFIIALLNSNLIGWYHHNTSPKAKKGLFPKVLVNDINNFPIKQITPEEQQPFIKLVDEILEKKKLGQETADLENKIDCLVYHLYDLTDEEIAIVEGNR